MTKTIKIFIYLFLALVLWGCAGSVTRQMTLPEWVKSPPPDNSTHWYGVGSGYNHDIAAKHALGDVASRLKVAVKSELEMHSTKETGNEQSTVSERINNVEKLSTGEVSFPGYEIQKSEEADGQAHVLVAIDRTRFVQQYYRDLEAADRTVTENIERLEKKQPIEQYIGKGDLQNAAYQLLALTDLLAAADNAFAKNAQHYRQRASDALSNLADVKNQLKFHILADSKSGNLQGAVREMFTEEQFPVTDTQGQDDTIVRLVTDILYKGQDAIGGYEISVKTQITMQTSQGHTVGSRRLTLYGASTNNYEYALQALADDFKAKVQKEDGIFTFLNGSDDSDGNI